MLAPPFPDLSFRLTLELDSGRPVIARPVLPDDRERLRIGFETLSDRTKQLRFFAPHPTLSDAELNYLTEIDHIHHVAWGLITPDADASPEPLPGIGIGRFVRLPATPDAAEFSLTIADDAQGTGAGRLLLALLVAHAHRVSVRSLVGLVDDDNETVRGWMHRLGLPARRTDDGLIYHVPTEPSAWENPPPSAVALLDTLEVVENAWPTESLRDVQSQ